MPRRHCRDCRETAEPLGERAVYFFYFARFRAMRRATMKRKNETGEDSRRDYVPSTDDREGQPLNRSRQIRRAAR